MLSDHEFTPHHCQHTLENCKLMQMYQARRSFSSSWCPILQRPSHHHNHLDDAPSQVPPSLEDFLACLLSGESWSFSPFRVYEVKTISRTNNVLHTAWYHAWHLLALPHTSLLVKRLRVNRHWMGLAGGKRRLHITRMRGVFKYLCLHLFFFFFFLCFITGKKLWTFTELWILTTTTYIWWVPTVFFSFCFYYSGLCNSLLLTAQSSRPRQTSPESSLASARTYFYPMLLVSTFHTLPLSMVENWPALETCPHIPRAKVASGGGTRAVMSLVGCKGSGNETQILWESSKCC